MTDSSAVILERFRTGYGKDIDLTLRPAYRDFLAKLGDPHKNLPPVFHVAGTNGKGSTCAFLRAMLEAEGNRVHVYTSPHLITFNERIRIAGELITENELAAILRECETLATPGSVSYFEVSTAAALVAFARHAADYTILEVGLGGRLDATNIIAKPLATLITRLSFDHREYLGDTMGAIAREKAGIMRANVPCFTAPQPDSEALRALRQAATDIGAPLSIGGIDWHVHEQPGGFRFDDTKRQLDLPPPHLTGSHQYLNAGLAIAALTTLPHALPVQAIIQGLEKVEWPARLQRLTEGRLAARMSPKIELWLDGGHNDSAGEVLAAQIEHWRIADGANPKPLYIVIGMLTTKRPAEFLGPFTSSIARLATVAMPHEPLSFTAAALAAEVRKLGIGDVTALEFQEMPTWAAEGDRPARLLICGSLYLAGYVLSSSAH
jgi:dihydrofolate synthase/folylpolyglutamate synthase